MQKNQFLNFSLSADEYRLLFNEPWEWTVLYLYLRMWMDFETGISGLISHFREDILKNVLYINPGQRREKQEEITRKKLRSILDGLERKGLIKRRPDLGPLVFEHLNALLDKSGQKNKGQIRAKKRANEVVSKVLIKKDNKSKNKNKGPAKNQDKGPPQNTEYINNKKHYLYRADEFLSIYPRVLGAPEKIKKYWIENNLDDIADEIITDVKLRIEKDIKWRTVQFTPGAMKYLEEKRWTNVVEVEGQRPILVEEKKSSAVSEEEMELRNHLEELQHWERFRENGYPKPCKEDCRLCKEISERRKKNEPIYS